MRSDGTAAVRVCSLEELERDRVKVISADDRPVAVFYDEGRVYAVDNRCPHMGFPLHRGSVKDGILTCHWHHAKFDLTSGCTFDMFADDAAGFSTEVRDGDVWLDPRPVEEERLPHWRRKLEEGMEHFLPLQTAKAVIGLEELGRSTDVLRRAALFGLRNRAEGWDRGLTILTCVGNVLPLLHEQDRPLALYQGVYHVARFTHGQPPNFDLEPMRAADVARERYFDWFRQFVEVRDEEAAERCMRTAISVGLSAREVADMVFAAATDHLFLDVGHTLDFANKAFEMVDHIGWDYANEILPSLIPGLLHAQRMEESSSWRHPVDLAELLSGAYDRLDGAISEGDGRLTGWDGHRALADQVLDGEAGEILERILALLAQGVPLEELSAAVAYAAALRAVHFPVSNEIDDWDTVLHSFSYANAVDRAVRRAPSALLARGILDAAMSVWLERFLNVPKRPVPSPRGQDVSARDLLDVLDEQGQVERAGLLVSDALARGHHAEVIATLGHALLREDAAFHDYQMYEAGLQQYRNFAGKPEGDHVLVAVARFLSAHFPTMRARKQTYDIAVRLHRGEPVYEGAEAD